MRRVPFFEHRVALGVSALLLSAGAAIAAFAHLLHTSMLCSYESGQNIVWAIAIALLGCVLATIVVSVGGHTHRTRLVSAGLVIGIAALAVSLSLVAEDGAMWRGGKADLFSCEGESTSFAYLHGLWGAPVVVLSLQLAYLVLRRRSPSGTTIAS